VSSSDGVRSGGSAFDGASPDDPLAVDVAVEGVVAVGVEGFPEI
jgi:hypothetical protein